MKYLEKFQPGGPIGWTVGVRNDEQAPANRQAYNLTSGLPAPMLSPEQQAMLDHQKQLQKNEGLVLVSPEFDLLTLGRSIATAPFKIFGDLIGKPKIPVKKGSYFRVVGKDAIKDAQAVGKVRVPVEPRLDMSDITRLSKETGVKPEIIQAMTYEQQRELTALALSKREGFKLPYRFKSNHGNVGFTKEGFFYKPKRDAATAVIEGSEKLSAFKQGHHGTTLNVLNEAIPSGKPVILTGNPEIANFTYWEPSVLTGWRQAPLSQPFYTPAITDYVSLIAPTATNVGANYLDLFK